MVLMRPISHGREGAVNRFRYRFRSHRPVAPNGELVSDGTFTYAYDALSRLTAAYSSGTLVVSNRYDHLGRRVVKIAADGTHTFLYDGWRPLVETIIHPDATIDRIDYVWGKDISGTLDGAAGIGGFLYVRLNGAIYVPFYDAYGNVMGYRDSNGAIVAEYTYDAFGQTVAQNGTMADMFAIRYSTKYYDKETGLYYYGKRHYSPVWRRWLTRDPIEEEGGVNLYGMCKNRPVMCHDAIGTRTLSKQEWEKVSRISEVHSWNCGEWPTLTDGSSGGTQAKYVAHFKAVTFRKMMPVPEDYISYFSYGIVAALGMSQKPNVFWCLDIDPLELQRKCVKGKYKYRIVITVRRLDRHDELSAYPEVHVKDVEGRTFVYGPK